MDAAPRIGVRSLTGAEKERLASTPGVEVWEFKAKPRTARKHRILNYNELAGFKCLVREAYAELLALLPEATDEELRWVLLKEHPTWRSFMEQYVTHAMTSTSRFTTDGVFAESMDLLMTAGRLKQKYGDDDIGLKEAIAEFMQSRKVYYSSRSFMQIVDPGTLTTTQPTDELMRLLHSRRESGDRPGSGLLQRDANEAKQAQRAFMKQEYIASLPGAPAVIGEGAGAAP